MDNPQSIRRATPDDLAPLIASATIILSEGALQPLSASKVSALVQRCVDRDRAIGGVIDGKDGIEASIGLVIGSFSYSDAEHLQVCWMGVHPEAQRQPHGSRLMEFACWAQSMLGVPLFCDLTTIEALQGKMHLYLRKMAQTGATFAFGMVPQGQYSQSRVGDDPLMERKRSGRAVPDARAIRPRSAAA